MSKRKETTAEERVYRALFTWKIPEWCDFGIARCLANEHIHEAETKRSVIAAIRAALAAERAKKGKRKR